MWVADYYRRDIYGNTHLAEGPQGIHLGRELHGVQDKINRWIGTVTYIMPTDYLILVHQITGIADHFVVITWRP